MDYYLKYLKYKSKYIRLRQIGGTSSSDILINTINQGEQHNVYDHIISSNIIDLTKVETKDERKTEIKADTKRKITQMKPEEITDFVEY